MSKKAENSEQDIVLQATLERIQKRFGKSSAVIPGRDTPRSEVRGVLPSGIDVLDRHILGLGGFPYGRMSELYSEPGVYKTSLVWTLLGQCIKHKGLAIYCDNEHSFDEQRAAMFGADPNKFILMQPWSLEEAMTEMQDTLENLDFKGPVFLSWDSIAGSQFKGDTAGNFDKTPQDDRARKLGQFCRAMSELAVQKQAHLLFVNQTRQKRGVLFGSNTTTPGGEALKFHASVRIQAFGGKAIKDKFGRHLGKVITVMAMKTRFSEPFRKARIRLDYARGWDNLWSTISHAKDFELIPAASKYDLASYEKAIEALKWEGAAKVELFDSVDAIEDAVEGAE